MADRKASEMKMVERMAVAMSSSKAWPAVFDAGRSRVLALAALKAMREPSEEMIDASLTAIEEYFKSLPEDHEYRQKGWFNGAKVAQRVKASVRFTAMIDAAIKEAEA